jgi:SAM-dependent methyltransferase
VTDWASGEYATIAVDLEPAAEQVVAAAGVAPGMRVLDVGCGTGNAALAAARLGASVTGVDSEPKLLAAAAKRPGGGDVRWLTCDLLALPVPDGAFDVVTSVFGVMFAGNARGAAGELARVLAPAGVIALANWIPEGPIAAAMGRLAKALDAPPRTGPSWGSEADVRALFEPHGLTVAAERRELAFEGDSPDDWVSLQERASPPLQGPREQLLARGRWDELRAALRADLEAANEDPGGFRVHSPWLLALLRRA